MGYIEIHNPDGTIIYLGEPQPMHIERIETCDVCNEPKPESDLIKIKLGTREEQKLGIDDAVWKCSKCHGVKYRARLQPAPIAGHDCIVTGKHLGNCHTPFY